MKRSKFFLILILGVFLLPELVGAKDKSLAAQCLDDGGKPCEQLQKDCNKKEIAEACAGLGFVRSQQRDNEAIDYFRKACRLGHKKSCDLIETYQAELDELKKKHADLEDQLQKMESAKQEQNAQGIRDQNTINAIQGLSNAQQSQQSQPAIDRTNCKTISRKNIYGNTEYYTSCEKQ